MKNQSRRVRAAVGIVVPLALGLAACGQRGDAAADASAGITDSSITLGVSVPLTGIGAGPGTCMSNGLKAYFDRVNAAGGIKFGDGQTRKVKLKVYDDAYDPARGVSDYRQMVADGVFASVGSLGAPAEMAVMPLANKDEFPQTFVASGASAFSANPTKDPWTIGWEPTYGDEGRAFGAFLAKSGKPLRVGILEQNDVVGQEYVDGFKKGIAGSAVKIVATTTFDATAPTVDSQITKLASSGANVFFSADSVSNLAASSLQQAARVGWKPTVLLASVASGISTVVEPGGGASFPGLYTTAFVKSPADKEWAKDPGMTQFVHDMATYAGVKPANMIDACAWGYATAQTAAAAFEQMKEPTRSAFMKASRSLRGTDIPLLLPGVSIDSTHAGAPPVNGVAVTKFAAGQYAVAKGYGK